MAVITTSAAVVAAMAGAGIAYAMWSSEDTFLGGLVTAGDLSITTGDPTWRQVTPGVSDPLSGGLETTPEFIGMPGDIVEIVQPVTTYLRGDNLVGGFDVQLRDPSALADHVRSGSVEISFRIEDADGIQVAPATGGAELGEVLPVPGLEGHDGGATASWKVVLTAELTGDYIWADAPTADLWSIGDIIVALRQVR
ncbi:hypothetical protein [Microbacterium stercoris]|uniref:Alternate-type signal peptide domain-containing protein n=1 Tax=Microbacterium stercoris TaxID=2820289 RepID=A0A939TXR5_9MICO|nr:hypothetical protein [Microbacterium stercoris]MBO3663932.1 hypothetical protein [Microbacterium stercoris]